ncbi:MAG TPA: YdcH family protein [Bryobacterales bacterium]|nr:YdcH family protein [Bryobacterales bacterium]
MGSIAEGSTSARLIETNEEYRTLSEQHSQYDDRLDELGSRIHLTTEEEVEEHRLKKLKLQTKDRMYAILREYEAQAS